MPKCWCCLLYEAARRSSEEAGQDRGHTRRPADQGMAAPMTEQLQRGQRRRGFPPPRGSVFVGWPTRWAIPDDIARKARTREAVLDQYRAWLITQPELLALIPRLRGRNIVCTCPLSRPCHGDLLLALANNPDALSELLNKPVPTSTT